MLIFGAAPRGQNKRLKDVLTSLGLTTNLQLCLDAGDINSYTGSGKWLDTSGNGYDFNNNGATFGGTAGRQSGSEYFSSDGDDYLTYDSANETWMKSLAKNSVSASFAVWTRTVSGSANRLCGTASTSFAEGIVWFLTTSGNVVRWAYRKDTTTTGTIDSTLTWPGDQWVFVAISIDEAAGTFRFQVNGSQEDVSATYSSPTSADPTNVFQIGAVGGGSGPMPNGQRIATFAAWDRALSASELTALFQSTRGRFGV